MLHLQIDPLLITVMTGVLLTLTLAHYLLRPDKEKGKVPPPLTIRYAIGVGAIGGWFTVLAALRALIYGPSIPVLQPPIDFWAITAAAAVATWGPRVIDRLLHPDWYARNDNITDAEIDEKIRSIMESASKEVLGNV